MSHYGMHSEEMIRWEDCHGDRLTVGAFVKVTEDSDRYKRLKDKTFMVVAITINSKYDVEIAINNGSLTNLNVCFDGFKINELTATE